jgi:hypothetical protein
MNSRRLIRSPRQAMASSDGGTVSPSILAVWWLMTSSNLLDCTTGRSEGFSSAPAGDFKTLFDFLVPRHR